MATIKEILQQFCDRINMPAPTSFVGSTSPAQRQYLALLRKIGDNLRNRPYAWPSLKRGYTFNTITGATSYQLPGDFYRLLESSQWDVTNQWPLRGPISDFGMALRTFGVVSLKFRKAYRIIGPTQYLFSTAPYVQRSAGSFQIDQAATNDTDELYLGYLSCNWIWPQDWVAGQTYAVGALRAGNGYVYRAATAGVAGVNRPSHATGSVYDGGGASGVQWAVYHEPYAIVSTNANLSDSDICLFDDDLMLDGIEWAYLKSKGQDYQQERTDWEDMVKGAFARFDGTTRFNASEESPQQNQEWPVLPEGGWDV